MFPDATLLMGVAAMAASAACNAMVVKPVEYHPEGQESTRTIDLALNTDIDILLVVDDSNSMAEEQARLAASFSRFIEILEDPDVQLHNYRIGVTTTDNGNPSCPATAEAGALVFESCRDRLEDFTSADGMMNVEDVGCLDSCPWTGTELVHHATTTDSDDVAKPRPWIESIGGVRNVGVLGDPDVGLAEIFACYGPQGIRGCGFESHLESMYKALARMETEGEDSYGFLRPEAILMIVILTDEVDCSYRHEHASIFSVDGNKVFWSDPEAEFPSSAVCWNAGVVCTGDPSDYECRSSNKDIEGNVDVHPSDAVLHPVSRYIEQVLDLEFDKKAINQTQEVLVSLVGGVGTDGTPHYAETIDPVFQEQFGIGAGCQSGGGAQTAIPPVRLAEFVAAFTEDNMHSVCEDDYGSAFGAIGNSFGTDPIPTCFVDCVLDSDPTTDLLEPLCSLEEHVPGEEESEAVDECARDENGWYIVEDGAYVQPAPDVNVCYAMRVDPDGSATADPNDDMSLEGGERYCFEVGLNLEFEIERRPGFYAAGGTSIEATCLISDAPESDCPEG